MLPLPGEDIVEHKAFEWAVHDPEYRKARIVELRRQLRWFIWGGSVIGLPGLVFFFTVSHFSISNFESGFLFCFLLGGLRCVWQASRRYSEVKILYMLDIQDRFVEGRKPEP